MRVQLLLSINSYTVIWSELLYIQRRSTFLTIFCMIACIHTLMSVLRSISHSTHQFHSNSASYITRFYDFMVAYIPVIPQLKGSNWGFCTPNKGTLTILASAPLLATRVSVEVLINYELKSMYLFQATYMAHRKITGLLMRPKKGEAKAEARKREVEADRPKILCEAEAKAYEAEAMQHY